LIESAHINVLILGKTGVGKSTLFNCMRDPTIDAFKQSVISQTKETVLQPFTVNIKNSNVTINLIDTPGLRESGLEVCRSDSVITQAIIECIEKEITKLHVLLICVSTNERFTHDDYKTIEVLTQNFCMEKSLPVIICVTKSEGKSRAWYNDRVIEIQTHPFFKELKIKTDYKICFSGYNDSINATIKTVTELSEKYQFVYAMRKVLLDNIYNCYLRHSNGYPINVLPYYKNLEIEATTTIHQFIDVLIGYVRAMETSVDGKVNVKNSSLYLTLKKEILQYTLFYDLSVMSAHFAMINDLLSDLYNNHKVRSNWIYNGFNMNVYMNQGSLTLDWDLRLKNLPNARFKTLTTKINLNEIGSNQLNIEEVETVD